MSDRDKFGKVWTGAAVKDGRLEETLSEIFSGWGDGAALLAGGFDAERS